MTGFTVDMVVIVCCNDECGMSFAVPTWWQKGKRETHKRFFCPNGHGQSYTDESDLDKAIRERDTARQQVARAEEERTEALALAAREEARADREVRANKKLQKRAAAGTCPCCQRTFANMSTHMKQKHPDYVRDTGANVVAIKRVAK